MRSRACLTVFATALALGQPFSISGADGSSDPGLENAVLSVTLRKTDGVLSILDQRTGRTWEQQSLGSGISVQGLELNDRIKATVRDTASGQELTAVSNGVTVTVNFGDKAFRLPDGAELGPGDFRAVGM